jgi:hypothetical protein
MCLFRWVSITKVPNLVQNGAGDSAITARSHRGCGMRSPRRWLLRKFVHAQVGPGQGKSCYWDEHEVENQRLGERIEKPDWEWAERDGETIVWAEKGRIYRAATLAEGLSKPRMLFDGNGLKLEAIPAPY